MIGTKLKTKAKPPPETRRLGYARVSTYGQTLDAQLVQLRADGCTRIYREKASGARPDRRELLKLLKALAPGDVVTVTRIDRLARSTFDLFAIVKQIVDAGGQFRSLAEPWADTATSTGRLMIAVLGGLADVERDLIRTRTAEGRSRAIARGQHMGRPPKLTDAQKAEARRRRAEGATLKELAQSYDVGLATISRLST
jgi:DNA invertase Pin-like site-specific DNA recombinase